MLHSYVSITHLQVSDSSFSLVTSVLGTVSISDARFSSVEVSSRMLKLREATVLLQNIELTQLVAKTNSPLCAAVRANFTITDSRLYSLMPREQGLIQMTDSSITFRPTTIQRYNVTFLYLTRTFFLIEDSYVLEGGLKLMDVHAKTKVTAGFLEGSDSSGTVRGSYFRDISGTSGGCFALFSASTEISSSTFENCYASLGGGMCMREQLSYS